VAALLDVPAKRLTNEDLDRMAEMIDRTRKEGSLGDCITVSPSVTALAPGSNIYTVGKDVKDS
jgi:hypothetical protein